MSFEEEEELRNEHLRTSTINLSHGSSYQGRVGLHWLRGKDGFVKKGVRHSHGRYDMQVVCQR